MIGIVALALAVGLVLILVRRRRAPLDSAYGHWQRDQAVLWHGRPVTVIFDYAAYLQAPLKRRVNVHTLQCSAMGERSIVGFCHDDQEDRTFKIGGIQGNVLIERTKESLSVSDWQTALLAGGFEGG